MLGSLINATGRIIGQGMANKANRDLAAQQQQWNIDQFYREAQQEEDFWNMENRYNEWKWDRDNRYNESRWQRENEYQQKLWHQQNKYNSPAEQMARLKEAGLSPHLMYGQGTVGNAGGIPAGEIRAAQQPASGLTSPDVQGYDRAQSESVMRGFDMFGDYHRFRNLEAQTNNVQAMTNVNAQEAELKATENLIRSIELSERQYKSPNVKEISDHQVNAAAENVKNLQQQNRKLEAEADVAIQTKDSKISKAASEAANEAVRGKILNSEKAIKAWEAELREKYNLTEKDWKVVRIIVQNWAKINGKLNQVNKLFHGGYRLKF